MNYQHTQKSSILLVGLTGGIASGKSTVAHMLEEMGSSAIDFDILARQVDEIASNDPDAIIHAVVPLLFEAGMQDLFQKIMVVYIPREKQIKRLMERDGISEGDAINILNAQ